VKQVREKEVLLPIPSGEDREVRLRGSLIHRLFEHLPDMHAVKSCIKVKNHPQADRKTQIRMIV